MIRAVIGRGHFLVHLQHCTSPHDYEIGPTEHGLFLKLPLILLVVRANTLIYMLKYIHSHVSASSLAAKIRLNEPETLNLATLAQARQMQGLPYLLSLKNVVPTAKIIDFLLLGP